MTLNADLAEGFGAWKMGDDEKLMPLIDMANIACGFHASDPSIMHKTTLLAKKHNCLIGAHVAYQDLAGFGRRSMAYESLDLTNIIIYQFGALNQIAQANGIKPSYIKPHGAMYNDMMNKSEILKAVIKAAAKCQTKLMIMSDLNSPKNKALAQEFGVELILEGFLDRAYTDDCKLAPRAMPNAVLTNTHEILQRLDLLKTKGVIKSINNKILPLEINSLCVHGDNQNALDLLTSVRKHLAN